MSALSFEAKMPDGTPIPSGSPPAQSDPELQNSFEKKIGISSRTLRKKFEKEEPSAKIKLLRDLMKSRIDQSMRRTFSDYRQWAAVDEAINTPTKSITPTILGKIMSAPGTYGEDGTINEDGLLKMLKAWDIPESELFDTYRDSNKQQRRVLAHKAFHRVRIPLVKSMTMIRTAKLFEEVDNVPLLSYQPSRWTEVNRVKCDIITALVDRMAQQYGIRQRLRQGLIQAGQYGTVLAFFAEAWHHEDAYDEDGKKHSVKEGLRINLPHVTRLGWDLSWPISTLNTGTGCEWALYWRIVRFGDLLNGQYWNTDKVTHGYCWLNPTVSYRYFQEIYPCVMQFPIQNYNDWFNNAEAQQSYYTINEDYDKACFLTDMAIRLIPNQWDLGDYDLPLWFRFQIASDDTVIFGEPLPDFPGAFLGWDTDEARFTNSSLALEALPFEDLISNVMTQHVLTVRQNLMKIIPFDIQQISEDRVRELNAQSANIANVLFFPFDSRQFRAAGIDPANMFKPISLGQQNTTELISIMNTIVTLMERMMSMSANEAGTIAGHITTARETEQIAQSTNTRLAFTGSYRDDFLDALKRRLFRYMITFMDEDFAVDVLDVPEQTMEKLRELGFKVTRKDTPAPEENRVEIAGKKQMLDIDAFVSVREASKRLNKPEIAKVMFQILQTVVPIVSGGNASPALQVKMLELIDRVGVMAGVPEDFEFKAALGTLMTKAPETQDNALKQAADQIVQQSVKTSLEQVKPLADAVKETQQALVQTQKQLEPMAKAIGETRQALEPMAQAIGQTRQQSDQADQQMAAVLKQFKEQIDQVAQALAQNRQQDEQVAAAVAKLTQVIGAITQQVTQAQPPPGMQPVQQGVTA